MSPVSERLRILSNTTVDGMPDETVQKWAGEAADTIDSLLEALERGLVLETSDLTGIAWKRAINEWVRQARAAIAKARGQQ